jgi:hypothetical protein
MQGVEFLDETFPREAGRTVEDLFREMLKRA